MDRPHDRLGVGRNGGGIEGRILDVVAHPPHVLLAHRLDVHQRTAMRELELTVARVRHRVAEVHELRRRADVELQPLEDRDDVVALELERPLHSFRVDRAGSAPLLDCHVAHAVRPECDEYMGESGAVDQVACEEQLGQQPGELCMRKSGIAR